MCTLWLWSETESVLYLLGKLRIMRKCPAWTGRCRRAPMPEPPLPLPTNRGLLLQWRAQPPGAPLCWDGRVEHVVSGQMEHFHSLEELLVFIYRVLAGVSAPCSARDV